MGSKEQWCTDALPHGIRDARRVTPTRPNESVHFAAMIRVRHAIGMMKDHGVRGF
jgi:hypothetical protein